MAIGYFLLVGDKTTCGGQIITGDHTMTFDGRATAREGDKVTCGKHPGTYIIVGGVAFLNNRLVQDAVIRNFEIIGEASNNIGKHYPNFAVANPELPLSFAYQMRTFCLIKNVIGPSGIAFPDLRKFQIK
ncbi:PAAR domain-containing protein [Photorhabdus bodei]|nr:PAAR domain-containing protein [Photorhabdus bodei]